VSLPPLTLAWQVATSAQPHLVRRRTTSPNYPNMIDARYVDAALTRAGQMIARA